MALRDSVGRKTALHYAMETSGVLLRDPSDQMRQELHDRVFKKLSLFGIPYQVHDFECVDYALHEVAPDLPMYRGPGVPEKALAAGDYFCVVGAAQTFGRLVREPWANRISEAIDLPVLNLSGAGLGPEVFLNETILELMHGARFIVLQMMSGRSVGCDEYPGGRRITLNEKTTGIHRLDILKEMWHKDPSVALHYIRKWNANYLEVYRQLHERIKRPTLLLWIGDRKPEDWAPEDVMAQPSWGAFPQLVGRDLFEEVAAIFSERYEHAAEPEVEDTYSRITGKPCPYFAQRKGTSTSFKYYPSSNSHLQLAQALTPWALDARKQFARS